MAEAELGPCEKTGDTCEWQKFLTDLATEVACARRENVYNPPDIILCDYCMHMIRDVLCIRIGEMTERIHFGNESVEDTSKLRIRNNGGN